MKLLIGIVVIGVIVFVLYQLAVAIFSPAARDARAVRKAERADVTSLKNDLLSERERSTLAQQALREISAGAEMPIFVAGDALSNINKTYTKEIQ